MGIFGHIDHGKSTLLDYIRKTNVVEKEAGRRHAKASYGLAEAGGITQHISAYEVSRKNADGKENRITFIDTPGHEAFANVRARGANVADIAVLVVSAEDGVKPQTIEVYKHIEESETPYIVAITKIDKPTADIDRTKQNLAENGIYVEGYGGNVSCVPVSGKTGLGMDELLDIIALQADILELKGNPEELGSGIIIESRLDPKRGITAVGIIKNGTVRKGTFAGAAGTWAPLRLILDAENKQTEELSFSSPAQMVGWSELPRVGSEFKTFLKKEETTEYANEQKSINNKQSAKIQTLAEGVRVLPIILKADTAGSLEVVENEITKLSRERIIPKVILSSVGSISENDIKSAMANVGAVILGFNAKTDSGAAALALRSGVVISTFNIIYELTEKVSKLLEERESRIEVEEISGSAKVIRLFSISKGKQVLGARVISGRIARGFDIKVMRRDSEIGRGKIKELQQAKVAANEVLEGAEFGAMIESKTEIALGDVLEAVTLVTK